MRTATELNKLRDQDIYSLVLFSLFKLRDIPQYASLSELVYLLDKDSLLKLCEYFGGMTLKIPTIDELECLVYTLVLYQYVDIEHKPMNEAVKLLGCTSLQLRQVKADYGKLAEILSKYDFSQRKRDNEI